MNKFSFIICLILSLTFIVTQISANESYTYDGIEYVLPKPKAEIVLPQDLPETYTIVSGDTLWDISGRFLGNSFLWPLIWDENVGEIPNPHKISPGQIIRFPNVKNIVSTTDPVGTTITAVDTNGTSIPGGLTSSAFNPIKEKEIEYVSTFADLEEDKSINDLASFSLMESAGFISPSNFKGPRLFETESNGQYVAEGNLIFINIGKKHGVKPGSRYEIVRQERRVFHPETKELLGYLIRPIGISKVLCVHEEASTVLLEKSFHEATKGDFVIPYIPKDIPRGESPSRDFCDPSSGKLPGYIVEAKEGGERISEANVLGDDEICFIDLGRRHNVKVGDFFVVFSKKAKDPRIPKTPKGEIVVLRVQESTATCAVKAVRKPIWVGDFIELK